MSSHLDSAAPAAATQRPAPEHTGAGASLVPGAVAAVSVNGLVKRYDEVEAVRGIDLEVYSGETFGFLGPQRRRQVDHDQHALHARAPERGIGAVAGHDVVSERDEVRRNIGLVFQDTTLDGYLSAEQNLRLHAELYGVSRDVGARADAPGDGDGGAVGAALEPRQHLLRGA